MPRKLLLVDDNESVRRILAQYADQLGFEYEVMAGGIEAIAALEKTRFDAVVCDILMPDVNGIEVLLAAKSHQPEVAFIAISGAGVDVYEDAATGLGADVVLSKPFGSGEFTAALARLLTE